MTGQWQRFIELGFFQDCFPQLILACFHTLSENRETFSLKDLIQKGHFVLSVLSIEIEHDSNFAVMDIFRCFDRTGRGSVYMLEFVLGVIDKIRALRKNLVLEDIADELLKLEAVPSELANKLEKGIFSAGGNKLSASFNTHMKAFSVYVRGILRSMSARSSTPKHGGYFNSIALPPSPTLLKGGAISTEAESSITLLTKASLVGCFCQAIDLAVSDTMQYFHISPQYMTGLLIESSTSTTDEVVYRENPEAVGLLGSSRSVSTWNLAGPRTRAGGVHSVADKHNDHTTINRTLPSSLEEDELVKMFDSTSGDRVSLGRPKGMHNQSSMDADFLHSISSSITQSLHQQIGDIDSNQLFLLQTAFRSLDSFFSTAQVGSQHPHDSVANKILSSTRTEVKTSSYDISKLSALVESSKREGEGMVGAVQLEVLEALLRSQNELRSAQMRVDILEMMQGQALSSSGAGSFGELGDDADEAKESPKDEYLTELSKVPFSEETIDTPEVAGNEKTQSLSMLVSHLPVASVAFDSILAELSILKACLSERASTDFPLGFFLENSNVAVVQSFVRTASAEEKLALDLSPAQSSRKEADTGSKNSQQPFVSLSDMLKDLQRCCSLLSHSTSIKTEDTVEHEKLLAVLAAQEERLAEYRTLVEQTEIERNEFMSMSVELQVLRERNQRISKEEITTRSLETKNNELSRQVKKLEEKLKELQEKNFSVDEVSMKEEERNIEIKNISQQHSARVDTMKLENERLSKENQRLKNAIQVSEQRVMGALQDQMTLHHQLQQMEEEAVAAKANITKLTREYEELRIARNYKEESDHKARELQREINKRDLELIEIREAANLSQKYQEELANAEKVIETLENKLSEYSIELERGRVAISQLDNYREQIRVKTKENRDMSLHIHALETQLKDVPYLQNRFTEVSDELQDCKVKLEKMPAVLSEMSRLRGSSRASVKALVEQDKQLAQLKHRVKLLEKETAVLRNDNRSMQDVEAKLKDANTEISRLMGMVAEVSTLKAGVKHAEEEKKQYEGQYKKMRKFIRQSTVAGITSGPSTPINSGMMKSVMSFGGSANTFSATINETNDPESQLDASSVASVTSEQADLAGGYSEALSRNSGHNNNIPFSQAEVSSGDDGGAGKTAVKSALNDIFAGTVKQ